MKPSYLERSREARHIPRVRGSAWRLLRRFGKLYREQYGEAYVFRPRRDRAALDLFLYYAGDDTDEALLNIAEAFDLLRSEGHRQANVLHAFAVKYAREFAPRGDRRRDRGVRTRGAA